jgi:hypothetical protein
MDRALVRMLLQSIIDGDPSQFTESERREAVRWLEARIYLPRGDKGSSRPQHQPNIERAASATRQALAHWGRGDKESAKRDAEEALKSLDG